MQNITKSQLQQDIHNKQDMLLIDVLPQESFTKKHIPSSINIPVNENPHFVQAVEAKAKSKNQRIVVYCASTQCDASEKAAQKLEQAGFTNVQKFEEGIQGWFGPQAAAA